MYPLSLQRSESQLGYLRYNVHQAHRCHNLRYNILNRVPDVVLAARLKYPCVGVGAAGHDRLRRFQAVGFSHVVPRGVVVIPLCCPALWWNYLGS
jgi:hypothetical protein